MKTKVLLKPARSGPVAPKGYRVAFTPQGSMSCRTQVLAYVHARNPILRKAEKYDVDVVMVDNLNCMVGMEVSAAWEKARGGLVGKGGSGTAFAACHWLLLIDHGLDEADKATLSGLVMNDAPLVVGPKAADAFTWHLKAEANSRGRIFEVAETSSAFEKLFESSLQAVRRRFAMLPRPAVPGTPAVAEPDPLASLPGVLEVTHGLRSERGRLDAEKIRDLFTLSRADLARLTGVQEETIRQTPDSERLQRPLLAFDRAARLLVLNPERPKFVTWLNSPNDELDQRTPLELIKEGRIEVIETLVHDIITNRGR